jgi:hypothetical protein
MVAERLGGQLRMGRRFLPLLMGLVLGGCGAGSADSAVKGSPADVVTAPGVYPGYRVVMPCPGSGVDLGIRGLGTKEVATADEVWKVGGEIDLSLRDLQSVWSAGGYGASCETGLGTLVHLDDWRDVDRVIARIGAMLRERDLSIQVGLSVVSVPVAQ